VRRAAALALAPALAAFVLCSAALADVNPADLEAELVCPTCKTTLDQSSAPVAQRMKSFIRRRIAAGDSAAEIKAKLVDQFGPSVLATPRKEGFDLLAWLLPLGVLAVGGVAVGVLAWSWSRGRAVETDADGPVDPELERRIDEELSRFEG
jgi:cytochrome c-type biogenesis protein CcmH